MNQNNHFGINRDPKAIPKIKDMLNPEEKTTNNNQDNLNSNITSISSNDQLLNAASKNVENGLKKPSDNNQNLKKVAFLSESLKIGRNKTQPVKPVAENGEIVNNLESTTDCSNFSKVRIGGFNSLNQSPTNIIEQEQQNLEKEILSKNDLNNNINSNMNNSYNKKPIINRNILLAIIGIIVFLLLIIFVILKLTSKKVNNDETIINCSKSDNSSIQMMIDSDITIYFNDNLGYKKEEINTYIFSSKDGFEEFKNNFKENNMYKIKGIEIQDEFNSNDWIYTQTINYDFELIKENSKTKKYQNLLDDFSEKKVITKEQEKGYICKKI